VPTGPRHDTNEGLALMMKAAAHANKLHRVEPCLGFLKGSEGSMWELGWRAVSALRSSR
jgi:hypothetical protein